MTGTENPWTILSEKKVYDNKWIGVTEFDVLNPSGRPGLYGKVHFKNVAVGIIPLDETGHTWLVGQYRFPLDQYSWEIPEGGCPPGEEPLEAARRELEEETGLQAGEWTLIQTLHLSNSVTDEFGCIYLARGLRPGKAGPEETEDLAVRRLPFDEVYRMVVEGTITDSLTVAAVLKVKLLLLEGTLNLSS
ncbi:MAG TPA: NUDIX hydrolase [Chitinophagaceae bacterium]|jgi:8-oxo-dGTP pyrophosphatase MutT (NUDIX family)|nr:NUDIX hydrolase [Chitinophagaceae bacterium]